MHALDEAKLGGGKRSGRLWIRKKQEKQAPEAKRRSSSKQIG